MGMHKCFFFSFSLPIASYVFFYIFVSINVCVYIYIIKALFLFLRKNIILVSSFIPLKKSRDKYMLYSVNILGKMQYR